MQISRFKKIILALVGFSFSHEVFASSVVQSEFEMLLPRSFQQDLIEQEWDLIKKQEFNFSWQLPDQNFDTPDVKVLLNGIKLDLATRLHQPNIGSSGDTALLESRGLESNLSIQSISIDQWITREVGGVIGRFHVQAKCEDVQLHLRPGKAQLTMQLSPVFKGALLRAQVDDANLAWTPDAWEIASLNCTGAEGFDDIVKEEIHKRTGDATIVTSQKAQLMQYVRDYVSAHSIDLSTPRSLVSARPDIKISMKVTDFVGTKKNAVLRGIVNVEFTQLNTDDVVQIKLGNDSIGSSSTAQVRIPEEFVIAVAKRVYAGNTWIKKVYSNQFSGFQALMKSRFNQFFVWRDLMNYPRSSKFLFDVYSPKNITLSGKSLSYAVKAPLYSKMYAPRGGKYIPYMNFSVPMTSNVKLSLKSGTVTAKFSSVKIGLQPGWDPSYVAKYHPPRTFATAKIRDAIQKSIQTFSMDYKLPKIPIYDQISFGVQKVQTTKKGDLLLDLKK